MRLKQENCALQQRVWTLEKRESRKRKAIPSPDFTPKSKVAKLCGGRFIPNKVKKSLLKSFATEKEIEVVLAVHRRFWNNTANCHTKVPLGTVVPKTHLVDLTRRTHKISRVGRFYRGVGGFNVKKLNSLNLACRCVLGVDSEGFWCEESKSAPGNKIRPPEVGQKPPFW